MAEIKKLSDTEQGLDSKQLAINELNDKMKVLATETTDPNKSELITKLSPQIIDTLANAKKK